jgi:hypothetical protein
MDGSVVLECSVAAGMAERGRAVGKADRGEGKEIRGRRFKSGCSRRAATRQDATATRRTRLHASSVLDERLAGGDVIGPGVVLHFGFGVSKLALVVHGSSGGECRSYIAGSAPAVLAALELLAFILRLAVERVHPVVARSE